LLSLLFVVCSFAVVLLSFLNPILSFRSALLFSVIADFAFVLPLPLRLLISLPFSIGGYCIITLVTIKVEEEVQYCYPIMFAFERPFEALLLRK